MKKILLPLAIILVLISFSHYYTKIPIYEIFNTNDYKIVNNELYYKKENTKDNYSSYLKYLNKDTVDNLDELFMEFNRREKENASWFS